MDVRTDNEQFNWDTNRDIQFGGIFDSGELENIQSTIADIFGVALQISYLYSRPVNQSINLCKFCELISNSAERGCAKNCAFFGNPYEFNECDSGIGLCGGGFMIQGKAYITAGDKIVTKWLFGQVRNPDVDEKQIKGFAATMGLDAEIHIKAWQEVSPMTQEKFQKASKMLTLFFDKLSAKGTENQMLKSCLTEQAESLNSQKEAEAAYRTIFQFSPLGILFFDAEGTIVDVNIEFVKIIGSSREALIGLNMLTQLKDESIKASVQSALKGVNEQYERVYHSVTANKATPVKGIFVGFPAKNGKVPGGIGIFEDTTERNLEQEALMATNARNQALLDALPDLMFVIDADCRFVDYHVDNNNDLYVQPDFSLGKTLEEVLPPDIASLIREKATSIINTTKFANYEYQLAMNDNIHHYEVRCVACGQNQVMAIIRNITEQKEAEAELNEKDHLIKSIAESSPNIIYIYDVAKGQNIYTNKNISQILGYKDDEITDKDPSFFQKLIHPDDFHQFDAFYQMIEHWEDCKVFDFEYRILSKQGTWRWFRGSEKEFQRVDEKVLSLIGTVQDITDKKDAEIALKVSEERYRFLAENTADTLALVDMNMNYTYISPSVMLQRGYTVKEAMAQKLSENTTPETFEIAFRVLSEELAKEANGNQDPNRVRIFELEQYCKDGSTVWVEVVTSFVRDEGGKAVGIYAVSRDINERKKLEKEKERNLKTQEALNEILQISLNNQSLDEGLIQILSVILSFPFLKLSNKGGIFIAEENQECLELRTAINMGPDVEAMCSRVPFGKCLCGRAASTHKMRFSTCIDTEHENRCLTIQPHGHYNIPLLGQSKVLGVLVLYLMEHHKQELFEYDFFVAIADILSGLIQRKQAEQALNESETRYRLIAENMADLIAVFDLELNFVFCSPSVTKLLGYSLREITTYKLDQILSIDSIHFVRQVFHEEMLLEQTGSTPPDRSRLIITENLREDGTTVWLEGKISFIRDENGKAKNIMTVSRDITERIKAERLLVKAKKNSG